MRCFSEIGHYKQFCSLQSKANICTTDRSILACYLLFLSDTYFCCCGCVNALDRICVAGGVRGSHYIQRFPAHVLPTIQPFVQTCSRFLLMTPLCCSTRVASPFHAVRIRSWQHGSVNVSLWQGPGENWESALRWREKPFEIRSGHYNNIIFLIYHNIRFVLYLGTSSRSLQRWVSDRSKRLGKVPNHEFIAPIGQF